MTIKMQQLCFTFITFFLLLFQNLFFRIQLNDGRVGNCECNENSLEVNM